MGFFEALIIALVEGITEFLPISSTGHMMITKALLWPDNHDRFVRLFIICIQFGAILSVVVIYYKKFFKSIDFYYKLIVAVIPTVIAGIYLKKWIDGALENVLGVAIFLFVGGIILLFVDHWFANNQLDKEEDISYLCALKIGAFQCLALFPGVSRSAATIIGGMSQKLTRKNAAEFSFFLAVPTMFGATLKSLYDYQKESFENQLPAISNEQIILLIFGNVVAFFVAILAIKFFVNYLNKNGFKIYGWYRIILGGVLIILHSLNIIK